MRRRETVSKEILSAILAFFEAYAGHAAHASSALTLCLLARFCPPG